MGKARIHQGRREKLLTAKGAKEIQRKEWDFRFGVRRQECPRPTGRVLDSKADVFRGLL